MVTTPAVLALFDEKDPPDVLARSYFFVPAPNRGGGTGRTRVGGVFLHQPTVAILLPSDFPPLSRRRPGFADLRHVLVRFSFMLDRLPSRHAYRSATLVIALDHPAAIVRAQRPTRVTADAESTDSVTTEFSAALDGLARIGAERTKVKTATYRTGRLPVITAENRGQNGFGWHYEAQEGAPLLPRIEFTLAVIELPREATELSGRLVCEAVVDAPRLGILTTARAAPAEPPVPFRLPLGLAA
jgi:hypothetical protein